MKKIIMKTTFISRTPITALLILLNISATPAYAAVAGRVLVSVGDSVAIRNGQEVRLRFGSQIEDKDTLRTSAAGTLQVRFTDQSIVALREKSTFKLEQYAYAKEKGGAQRAVFNLIKGGFRTITGFIGKSNQKSYSVKTAAATIGIRGTHYAVRVCEDDCKNPDGSNAKDGVYGSVLSASDKDSRIVINNLSGENEFSRDEHFYVKDEKSSPEMLLVPPSFVADNLKGRGQVAEKNKQDDGKDEDQGRDNAKGGSDHDPRPKMVFETHGVTVAGTEPNCSAGGGCKILLQRGPKDVEGLLPNVITTKILHSPVIYAADFSVAGGLATTVVSGSGTTEKLLSFTAPPFFNFVSGVETNLLSPNPLPANTDMVDGLAAINAHWGRWVNGALDIDGFINMSTGVHYIYGFDLTSPSAVAARTGIFNFTHVGGTTPTDGRGNIASASSFGSMFVNFQTNDGVMSPMNWTINGTTHNINSVDITLAPDAQLGVVIINGTSIDGICSGAACGLGGEADTTVTGAFAGANGNYAALSIATSSNAGGTASAQVYQCANCGSTAGITPAGAVVAYAGGTELTTFANTDIPLFILPTDKTLDVEGALTAYNTLLGDSASLGATGLIINQGVAVGGPSGDGYGLWDGGSITGSSANANLANANLPATPFTPASGIHVLYSAALTLPEVIAAKTGTFNFNHAGGTLPTDHLGTGTPGTFGTGSNLSVNFTAQTGLMNANWNVGGVNGVSYTLNATPLTLLVDGAGAHIGAFLPNDVTATCSVCSGLNGTIDSVNIQGNFSGAAGNTINMAISTFDAGISVVPVTSASVQVFQEALPPVTVALTVP